MQYSMNYRELGNRNGSYRTCPYKPMLIETAADDKVEAQLAWVSDRTISSPIYLPKFSLLILNPRLWVFVTY